MKRTFAAAVALTAAMLSASSAFAASNASPPPEKGRPEPMGIRVGGPCTYADHPGTATILAVSPATPDKDVPTPPYPGLTVTYAFAPVGPLPPQASRLAGKVQTMTLVNGWPPGPRFLEKYGIRPGAALPCVLRVIQSGTCTPLLFEFPGIDLADYFEIEK
ncbi:hypothetical protein G3N56_01155 [Desulfovibrio sulfodismutans]|uniref:Uncharacterized protein n=1 Tax=Desulfolutivibrio sulfodismutans TaxID=63561 RepID=A0A7K3NHS1_9BACT|nr:hypothetical protein [Desulfolutivibrio sulfodismutans]NDY55353.1 hypothetical protein [Desulfolutivibrio sulfodismutans]QLA11054.1 hypothetical protein GD606_01530 [Desulfolutivibrio sulfodismutans DSM 3696]